MDGPRMQEKAAPQQKEALIYDMRMAELRPGATFSYPPPIASMANPPFAIVSSEDRALLSGIIEKYYGKQDLSNVAFASTELMYGGLTNGRCAPFYTDKGVTAVITLSDLTLSALRGDAEHAMRPDGTQKTMTEAEQTLLHEFMHALDLRKIEKQLLDFHAAINEILSDPKLRQELGDFDKNRPLPVLIPIPEDAKFITSLLLLCSEMADIHLKQQIVEMAKEGIRMDRFEAESLAFAKVASEVFGIRLLPDNTGLPDHEAAWDMFADASRRFFENPTRENAENFVKLDLLVQKLPRKLPIPCLGGMSSLVPQAPDLLPAVLREGMLPISKELSEACKKAFDLSLSYEQMEREYAYVSEAKAYVLIGGAEVVGDYYPEMARQLSIRLKFAVKEHGAEAVAKAVEGVIRADELARILQDKFGVKEPVL